MPSAQLRLVDATTLERVLPVSAAVAALDAVFRRQPPAAPQRSVVSAGDAQLLLMPAVDERDKLGAGVKLVTLQPANPDRGLPLVQGVYVLFEPHTLTAQAVVDGAALTAIRTAAVSALATRELANPDAARLVLFGAGTQAVAHLDAMRAVRPIASVRIVSRGRERAEALVARARALGLDAALAARDAVADADIVCTCTTSREPLFDGALLAEGAHVNAVGAFEPDARELDDATFARAHVVVEDRDAVFAEAGDVRLPMSRGVLAPDDVVTLHEVLCGTHVRDSALDVTVFKSVGVAYEDLAVARALLQALDGQPLDGQR